MLNRFVAAGLGLALPPLGWPVRPRAAADVQPVPPPAEGLSPPEIHRGGAVALDGDTLRLATGAEVRLAGIEAPKPALAPGGRAMAGMAAASTAALQAAIGPGPIALRYDGLRHDRYGRLLAQVANAAGDWLQAVQIAAGQARVHGDGRNRIGLRALLAREGAARNAREGIWRSPAFAVREATDPALHRLAGTFQLVTGRVVAAAVVRGTGYVNFGTDRRTDLTLTLKEPVLAMDGWAMDGWATGGWAKGDPAMLHLPGLAGRLIRCRGWLDLYDGPWIEITYPEQLEIVEE